MARHEVVKEACDSIVLAIETAFARAKLSVDVVCEPPSQTFIARPKSAVTIYPYSFVPRFSAMDKVGMRQEKGNDEQGEFVVNFSTNLALDVQFAVVVHAQTLLEQIDLLAVTMKSIVEYPTLTEELKLIRGANMLDRTIGIDYDDTFDFTKQVEFLTAMGISHRPCVGYSFSIVMETEREMSRSRRVERRQMNVRDATDAVERIVKQK